MPKSLGYRRKIDAPPDAPASRFPRWVLFPAALLLTAFLIALIAGPYALDVFATLLWSAFPLSILLAAAMLGLALTAPLAPRQFFANSPWPDAWRLVIATALGLGALSLATLLLGTLHLLHPPWTPPLTLVLCALLGFYPTRTYLRTLDWTPLTTPLRGLDTLSLLACAPLALLLVAASYPPGTLWASEGGGYDVLSYHLQLPKEYLAANSTAPVSHNVYSYMPANVEMLYVLQTQLTHVYLHSASPLDALYPAALLHVSLTLLTACAVALLPISLGATSRWLALLIFLGIPWTLVCGSLAYNESGMLLWGTLALGLLLPSPTPFPPTPKNSILSILTGVFIGLSIGAKLTAGLLFALPCALLLLLTGGIKPLVLTTLTAIVLVAPWAFRTALASGGNPVFPLATTAWGHSTWTPEQADRWNRGHAPKPQQQGIVNRLAALRDELVLQPQWSSGVASFYKWVGEPPGDNPWSRLGLLWILALVLLPLALIPCATRAPASTVAAALLAVVFLVQLLLWLGFTHLQSRFLLPCAIPLSLLLALGVDTLRSPAWRAVFVTAISALTATTIFLLLPEKGLFMGDSRLDAQIKRSPQPLGLLYELEIGGPQSDFAHQRICLLGDSAPLYYFKTPVYATVFDRHPLIEALRAGGPEAAAAYLRDQSLDILIVNWNEITRLRSTYGFDTSVTPEAIQQTAARAGLTRSEQSSNGVDIFLHPQK